MICLWAKGLLFVRLHVTISSGIISITLLFTPDLLFIFFHALPVLIELGIQHLRKVTS